MGGDNAPQAVIDGLAFAHIRHPKAKFLLHGDHARLQSILLTRPALKNATQIVHCDDVVGMDDKPSQALRRGRNTSMWRAIDSVRNKEAQVVVSAGNTGALMAMAKVQLRMVPGLSRPAIAAIWPTIRGQSVVLDVGANIDTDARQLFDFALIGEAYARVVLGLDRPDGGTATVNGVRYADLVTPLREVGALLDAGAVHPGRTGRTHLRIAARSNGIPRARVEEVLGQVGLAASAAMSVMVFLLGAVTTWSLEGDELVITAPDGEIRAQRQETQSPQ
jgi:glycerol-3-phosphate acyltransferase PlsX